MIKEQGKSWMYILYSVHSTVQCTPVQYRPCLDNRHLIIEDHRGLRKWYNIKDGDFSLPPWPLPLDREFIFDFLSMFFTILEGVTRWIKGFWESNFNSKRVQWAFYKEGLASIKNSN